MDLWAVFTRVGNWREAPLRTVALLSVLLLINYAVNLAVLGVPALSSGVPIARSAKDLIGFTLIAQVADRLGVVAGFALATALGFLFKGEAGLALWVLTGLILNFVMCGVAIGFLAYHYLKRRWAVPTPKSRWVALAAGFVTNPSWVMATWWFAERH